MIPLGVAHGDRLGEGDDVPVLDLLVDHRREQPGRQACVKFGSSEISAAAVRIDSSSSSSVYSKVVDQAEMVRVATRIGSTLSSPTAHRATARRSC